MKRTREHQTANKCVLTISFNDVGPVWNQNGNFYKHLLWTFCETCDCAAANLDTETHWNICTSAVLQLFGQQMTLEHLDFQLITLLCANVCSISY